MHATGCRCDLKSLLLVLFIIIILILFIIIILVLLIIVILLRSHLPSSSSSASSSVLILAHGQRPDEFSAFQLQGVARANMLRQKLEETRAVTNKVTDASGNATQKIIGAPLCVWRLGTPQSHHRSILKKSHTHARTHARTSCLGDQSRQFYLERKDGLASADGIDRTTVFNLDGPGGSVGDTGRAERKRLIAERAARNGDLPNGECIFFIFFFFGGHVTCSRFHGNGDVWKRFRNPRHTHLRNTRVRFEFFSAERPATGGWTGVHTGTIPLGFFRTQPAKKATVRVELDGSDDDGSTSPNPPQQHQHHHQRVSRSTRCVLHTSANCHPVNGVVRMVLRLLI